VRTSQETIGEFYRQHRGKEARGRAIDRVAADDAGYVGHRDAAWLPVLSAGELLLPEAVSTATEWAKIMATRAHVGAQRPAERASAIILSPRAARGAFRTDVPVQPIVGKIAQVLCTSMTSLLHNRAIASPRNQTIRRLTIEQWHCSTNTKSLKL
jgi:hypothetical protein